MFRFSRFHFPRISVQTSFGSRSKDLRRKSPQSTLHESGDSHSTLLYTLYNKWPLRVISETRVPKMTRRSNIRGRRIVNAKSEGFPFVHK